MEGKKENPMRYENYENSDVFSSGQRHRKKHRLLFFVIFLILSVWAVTSIRSVWADIPFDRQGNYSSVSGPTGAASAATLAELKSMESKEPKLGTVLQNPERYPEPLLKALTRNPELLNFTLDYPDRNGKCSDRIDLSQKYKPGSIPLLMQWDEDWGYAPYGNGIIGLDGCGPACLSMVLVGLTGKTEWNPKKVAQFSEQNGYLDEDSDSTRWTLMSEGAEKLGLKSGEIPLSEDRMADELSAGHPIICILGPGDFTTDGHFIVLTSYSGGSFTVRDPFSKARSAKQWSYQTLKPQIRNLWVYSA
jgi:hypothetical protein